MWPYADWLLNAPKWTMGHTRNQKGIAKKKVLEMNKDDTQHTKIHDIRQKQC